MIVSSVCSSVVVSWWRCRWQSVHPASREPQSRNMNSPHHLWYAVGSVNADRRPLFVLLLTREQRQFHVRLRVLWQVEASPHICASVASTAVAATAVGVGESVA